MVSNPSCLKAYSAAITAPSTKPPLDFARWVIVAQFPIECKRLRRTAAVRRHMLNRGGDGIF